MNWAPDPDRAILKKLHREIGTYLAIFEFQDTKEPLMRELIRTLHLKAKTNKDFVTCDYIRNFMCSYVDKDYDPLKTIA